MSGDGKQGSTVTQGSSRATGRPQYDDDQPPPSYDQAIGINIALNNDFISHDPLSLSMKREAFSKDFQVIDGQGKPVLRVDCPMFSTAHEMTIINAPTNQHLFTVTKKAFSMSWRYSAEIPTGDGYRKLFETETIPGFFSGGQTFMKFTNATNGEMEQLTVDLHRYTGANEVKYKDKIIAHIDRDYMAYNWSLHIHVGGVDPLLIVVLALVINDRIRTKR